MKGGILEQDGCRDNGLHTWVRCELPRQDPSPADTTLPTDGPEVALSGESSVLLHPLVQLVSQLTPMVRHRPGLGGFGDLTGLEASLLGPEDSLLEQPHIFPQLAEVLLPDQGLFRASGGHPRIEGSRVRSRYGEILRPRAPRERDEQ